MDAELELDLAAELPIYLEFIGKLHPLLVHFPVALTIVWLGCELLSRAKVDGFDKVSPWMAGLTCLSYAPAMASGVVRSYAFRADAEHTGRIADHRDAMMIAICLVVGCATWRIAGITGRAPRALVVLIAAAAIAMSVGAHWGGLLVYGDAYFP